MYTKITLSADEEVIRAARRHTDGVDTTINELVRDYLKELAATVDSEADAAELERLSLLTFSVQEFQKQDTRFNGATASAGQCAFGKWWSSVLTRPHTRNGHLP